MKLLFVIKTLALAGGGTERVVADVTAALAERGHDITLVSFDRPEDEPFYRLHPAVRRRPLGIGDTRRRTGMGEAVRRMAALRRLVGETRPDVTVGFMHSVYIPLGLALLGTGIPLVASEHISYAHYRTVPLQAPLLRLAPFLAQAITAISPAIRDGFPSSIRKHMTVVPNPVSANVRARADVRGEDRTSRTLLAVGRLEDQKDHRTLIRAFAEIAGDFPDWRLRIVGEGELRPDLEALVRRHRLEGRVALPGAISEIGEEYEAAQLFVMSSSYESFGLTSAEALAHGLPVIGFADCPGTNELVQEGVNGRLVEGADRATALAAGLAGLMRSPGERERLGAAGPASIECFAPERITDVWEALLNRVIARHPASNSMERE